MPSLSDLRKVANINTLDWELLEDECKDQEGDIWWYNLSYNFETGEGSYLYKMGPNTVSKAHSHTGPEEFFILEGDLKDSDGLLIKKEILYIWVQIQNTSALRFQDAQVL